MINIPGKYKIVINKRKNNPTYTEYFLKTTTRESQRKMILLKDLITFLQTLATT